MKRSEVNAAIREAVAFFRKQQFPLPPFAYWTRSDWRERRREIREIIDTRLGWDVTDFGRGDFARVGRTIFTLRNGHARMKDRYPKTFAQKVMLLKEGQKSPVHFHKSKTEDIINQGGGETELTLWKITPSGRLSDSAFTLSVSGMPRKLAPGGRVILTPGESITLPPGTVHEYWARPGCGPVLSVEVSSVNDDFHDNVWLAPAERFPEIIEDEPPYRLLVADYAVFT
jgi:hypothetical protein